MPPAPKLLAWVVVLGVTASSAYGAGFWALRDRGPEQATFQEAAGHIRGQYQKGDLIVLVPFYATRARELLGDLHPVAVHDPLAEDLRAHRRLWVFGLFGEAAPLKVPLEHLGHKQSAHDVFDDAIEVDLYEINQPRKIGYSFVDNIHEAKVWWEQADGKREACDRWDATNKHGGPGGRWVCPRDSDWFFVGPEWHRMGEHLRYCLWAHPPQAGRLVVRFEGVPFSGTLYGHAGHTTNASMRARERVDLDVELESVGVQRFSFALEDNFRPFALSTPTTGTATVTFAVSTPDNGANHFCFAADMRSP